MCTFSEGESEIGSKLAIDLLSEKTTPQTISLVAETDGTIVGHIAFSPVTIDNNENFQGYILAPLGVKPDYQKRRFGSKLIEYGMRQLSDMEVNVVFVYGDPKYSAGLVSALMLQVSTPRLIGFNIPLGGKPSCKMNVILKEHL